MAWPLATDYSTVIQNPGTCFADTELAAGQSATDMLGLPLTFAGNFANVYKLLCPNDQAWAVKRAADAWNASGARVRFVAAPASHPDERAVA